MAMSDTFAGLVGMRMMNSVHHDHCLHLGSITELNRDPAPFFISRPAEEKVSNKTKTLLDLCRELIQKTEEQQKSLTAMGNEITRLNARIIDMENQLRHREWRNAQREPVYGQREKPKDQHIDPNMFRVPDEIIRGINGDRTFITGMTVGTSSGTGTTTTGNPVEVTSENARIAMNDMYDLLHRQQSNSRVPEFMATMEAARRDYIALRANGIYHLDGNSDGALNITPITGVDYDDNEPPF